MNGRICFLFAIFFTLIASTADSAEKKLTFAAIQNSHYNKFAARVIVEAYSRIGYDVEIHYLPGKRALIQSSSGELDGESNRVEAIANKYPTLIKVPSSFDDVVATAFYVDDKVILNSKDDLADYQIGILRGVLFSEKLTKGYQRHYANSVKSLFNMLVQKRVDVILFTRLSGHAEIARNHRSKGIKAFPVSLLRIPVFNYLHEKNRQIVDLIDPILQNMRSSGEVERIKQDYLDQIGQ